MGADALTAIRTFASMGKLFKAPDQTDLFITLVALLQQLLTLSNLLTNTELFAGAGSLSQCVQSSANTMAGVAA